MSPNDACEVAIAEEDVLRAQFYGLLARVLATPPSAETLALLSGLAGDETEIGRALSELAERARRADTEAAAAEYSTLFIGVTQGDLLPFGSYYMTGFLHEKPLARLRADMARLGIARARSAGEPEDHIAALCEMMRGLILGAFGDGPAPLVEQRRFFDAHVGSWAERFFCDLEAAASADLYRPVGTIGHLFLAVESQGFAMAA